MSFECFYISITIKCCIGKKCKQIFTLKAGNNNKTNIIKRKNIQNLKIYIYISTLMIKGSILQNKNIIK